MASADTALCDGDSPDVARIETRTAAASSVIERYEKLIRAQARSLWHASIHGRFCDAEDVEQEVLAVLWRRREKIAEADDPISFVAQAARYEARWALKNLCPNGGAVQMVSIEGCAAVSNVFYSSGGGGDGFVD
ncbi:MAG: hypothetical protein R6V19_15075 [Armatimonadota bacterium]